MSIFFSFLFRILDEDVRMIGVGRCMYDNWQRQITWMSRWVFSCWFDWRFAFKFVCTRAIGVRCRDLFCQIKQWWWFVDVFPLHSVAERFCEFSIFWSLMHHLSEFVFIFFVKIYFNYRSNKNQTSTDYWLIDWACCC